MFENYVGAKTRKRPKWVGILITASVVLHSGAAAALIVRQFWMIDKLPTPKDGSEISLGGAPPPPPPPKGGKKKQQDLKKEIKKIRTKDAVQPVKDLAPVPEENTVDEGEGEDVGVEGGVEGGVAGGVVGGVLGGTLVGSGPPPPPPPPDKPQVVPQAVLDKQFLSGDREIKPSKPVQNLMYKAGQKRTITTIKMCLSAGGAVDSVRVLKSSGFDEYDREILAGMRQWRYRPFRVNDRPVPVCTSVTFIFRFAG
jgi:protein TonB